MICRVLLVPCIYTDALYGMGEANRHMGKSTNPIPWDLQIVLSHSILTMK
jgi:hypothetical protein